MFDLVLYKNVREDLYLSQNLKKSYCRSAILITYLPYSLLPKLYKFLRRLLKIVLEPRYQDGDNSASKPSKANVHSIMQHLVTLHHGTMNENKTLTY